MRDHLRAFGRDQLARVPLDKWADNQNSLTVRFHVIIIPTGWFSNVSYGSHAPQFHLVNTLRRRFYQSARLGKEYTKIPFYSKIKRVCSTEN